MTIHYPARIPLALTPTPLQPIDRISESLGGPRIWVKRDDLSGSLLSGNKVRKLEFIVARALAEGCDTLITCGGLQSNHCRATALVGAQLGLKVHLVLRAEGGDTTAIEADGNYLLDKLAGASISTYSLAEYSKLPQLLHNTAEDYRRVGCKPFIIPTGASDGIGIWGYIAASEELQKDCATHNIAPKYIVTATGSGGTQAGLILGHNLLQSSLQVVGMAVCDSTAYFKQKIHADVRAWKNLYAVDIDETALNIVVNDCYIGPGYAKATQDVFQTIQWLAQQEGIILDPVYTGKAFYGLIQEIKQGNYCDASDIIFMHTGGVFGIYPYRHQFKC